MRFGDPECQVLMLRLRSDLVELVDAVVDGELAGCTPAWDARASAGVVLAAAGYPDEPVTVRRYEARRGARVRARRRRGRDGEPSGDV